MVVVTLGLGLLVFSGQNLAKNHKWSCYDGSYIEVNGKRITDVKKIMPCIIETLEYANEVEQLARQRIDEIHRSEQEIKKRKIWSITKILDRYEKENIVEIGHGLFIVGLWREWNKSSK